MDIEIRGGIAIA